MGKKAITYSFDIEASGPIPGPWWMCSLGVCRTEDVSRGFIVKLKPLVIPGFSEADRADAMRIVALGVQGLEWNDDDTDDENLRRVRAHFEEKGQDPLAAMDAFEEWLREDVGTDRPVLIASPVTFDFMWLYWYWWRLKDSMPPFGFSGLDLRSYFMGSHGVGFQGTGKERYLKHYPNEFSHTHDPLEDARQQGQIWNDMVEARKARGKL